MAGCKDAKAENSLRRARMTRRCSDGGGGGGGEGEKKMWRVESYNHY